MRTPDQICLVTIQSCCLNQIGADLLSLKPCCVRCTSAGHGLRSLHMPARIVPLSASRVSVGHCPQLFVVSEAFVHEYPRCRLEETSPEYLIPLWYASYASLFETEEKTVLEPTTNDNAANVAAETVNCRYK